MPQKNLIVLAAGVIGGALLLTGCGGGTSTVSGNLDDVKWVPSVKAVPAVTHKTHKTETKYKNVCVAKNKAGRCTRSSRVKDGTKTVTVTVTDKPAKPSKSAMYCVELDNVNGKRTHDDQWYLVSWSTYSKWSDESEGTKVRKMEYQRSLLKCKR